MNRHDGRALDALRPIELQPDAAPYAEGSCLVIAGRTRVLCTASVATSLPSWRLSSGLGWVTAEYGMLPRATHTRSDRERNGPKGRTQEIQRLIGRSLRAVTDLTALGPRAITLDCDVLQADGGTRTASITGAWVALHRAGQKLVNDGLVARNPVTDRVAAVSVGVVEGSPVLDLDYREDSNADVDMNVVSTGSGRLIEVQGTAEKSPFDRRLLDEMLDLALKGIGEIMELQQKALG